MSLPDAAEQNIQMWKTKKLIKSLDSARGCVVVVSELLKMIVNGRARFSVLERP